MKRSCTLTLALLLLVLISAQSASVPRSSLFKGFNVTLFGRVQDTVIEDLDQDGLKDICGLKIKI